MRADLRFWVLLAVVAVVAGGCGGGGSDGDEGGPGGAGDGHGDGAGGEAPGAPCGGPCDPGATCLADVCVRTPSIPAALGGEEVGDDGKSHAMELDIPPRLSCWETPDAAPDEPREVTVRGKVDELAVGPSKDRLCITVYDQEDLLTHWRTESRCPGLTDVAARVECFRTDACRCAEMDGADAAAKAACETDAGPVLAHTRTVGKDEGAYELPALPTNRPLVFRLSGHPELWKETFMWGVEVRTDRLETADDGAAYERLDPIGVSSADYAVVQALLGLASEVPVDRGAIAGELRDCGDAGRNPEPLMGASFHIDPVGLVQGFHNGDPEDPTGFTPTLAETRNLGIFGAVGVPEGDNRFVAAAQLDGRVQVAADYDLYVPPSAGVILYSQGRVGWRARP